MENVFVKNKSLLKKIIPAFFCSLIVILARIPPFRTFIFPTQIFSLLSQRE